LQTAEIPAEALGRQGQCNNCGALVAIPARLTKVCFGCGTDVTNIEHRKDRESNYLCIPCFQQRSRSEQAQFALTRIECSICHVRFPHEQATMAQGRPVCRDCAMILSKEDTDEGPIPFVGGESTEERHGGRPIDPTTSVSTGTLVREAPATSFAAVAESQPSFEDLGHLELEANSPSPSPQLYMPRPTGFARSPKQSKLPLILSALALAGVIVLGTVQFTSKPDATRAENHEAAAKAQQLKLDLEESEIITRLLVLKGQAETLIDVGKPREAIQKYDTLLRLADGKSFRSANITAEIANARLGREQTAKALAAATTQAPIREVEEKPTTPPEPVAPVKPTIFDDK
jgi:hypothetical protein